MDNSNGLTEAKRRTFSSAMDRSRPRSNSSGRGVVQVKLPAGSVQAALQEFLIRDLSHQGTVEHQ